MLREIKDPFHHYFVDENGRKQGEYEEYRLRGQIWEQSFFLNGKRHGECKLFHRNDKLHLQIFFHYGKQHGVYKCYDQHGELIRSTFFYHGTDLDVNPDTLTEKDKAYILLSGRLPPRD